MSLTLDDANPKAIQNANFLLSGCEFAYLPEIAGQDAFRSHLGLEAKLISVDNTQVYIAENDASIVVAFRGSEAPTTVDGIKDWLLTNADNFLILPEGQIGTDFAAAGVGARFHKGFMGALADIWEPFYSAVDTAIQAKARPLWITGHSLGGALAVLAAWRLQQNFLSVHQITTFGAPMVGNNVASEAFKREFPGKILRFVDKLDLVPLLPTVSLIANTYIHCHDEHLLDSRIGDPAMEVVKGLASRTVDGLLDLTMIDELWGQLAKRVEHHMVANYQIRIKESDQSLG